MTTRKKPTQTETVAAWKAAYDIVLDDLTAQAQRIVGLEPSKVTMDVWLMAHVELITEASRTAALMAPWSKEED